MKVADFESAIERATVISVIELPSFAETVFRFVGHLRLMLAGFAENSKSRANSKSEREEWRNGTDSHGFDNQLGAKCVFRARGALLPWPFDSRMFYNTLFVIELAKSEKGQRAFGHRRLPIRTDQHGFHCLCFRKITTFFTPVS